MFSHGPQGRPDAHIDIHMYPGRSLLSCPSSHHAGLGQGRLSTWCGQGVPTWGGRADEERAERAKQRLQSHKRGGLPLKALPFVLCGSDIVTYLGAGEAALL